MSTQNGQMSDALLVIAYSPAAGGDAAIIVRRSFAEDGGIEMLGLSIDAMNEMLTLLPVIYEVAADYIRDLDRRNTAFPF